MSKEKFISKEEFNKAADEDILKAVEDIHKGAQKEASIFEVPDKFEGLEYEEEKKKYDPLCAFLFEKGIDSKEFNFGYNVVEKIEKDPKDPEKISASTKRFNNYHDYLKFQKSLTEEQRKEFIGSSWTDFKGNFWINPAVFAGGKFWEKVKDPNNELYKFKDEIYKLEEKISNEEIEDEYAKAVERGEVKEREPKKTLGEKNLGKFKKGEKDKKEKGKLTEKIKEVVVEKEKSPEEIKLDEKRSNYAKSYKFFRNEKIKIKGKDLANFEKTVEPARKFLEAGDRNRLNILREKEIDKLSSEERERYFKEGEESRERRKKFIEELTKQGITETAAWRIYDTELVKLEYDNEKLEFGKKLKEDGVADAEIFKKLILDEKEALNLAKVESWPPKEKGIFRKGMECWMKLPRSVRIASSVLLTTGALYGLGAVGVTLFGAKALAGASMTKLAIFGGQRFARALAGATVGQFAAKGVEKVFFGNLEKIKEEELKKLEQEFPVIEWTPEKLKEFEKKRDEIFETHYKKERNKNLVKAATAIITGAGTAVGLGFLEHAWAGGVKIESAAPETSVKMSPEEFHKQYPGLKYSAGIEDADIKLKAAIGVEAPQPIAPVGELKANVLEIGARGPEGAIIDYFRENPDIAVEKFDCPKELYGPSGEITDLDKFNEWAGGKAHRLWLEDAKEALNKPEMLEQLKKLGYSPDDKGYAQMMHRIGKGSVELDFKTGKIDLVNDTEYLKARIVPDVSPIEQAQPIKVPPEYFDGSKKMLYEEDIERLNKKYPADSIQPGTKEIPYSNVQNWLENKAKIDVEKSSWLNEKSLGKLKIKEVMDSGFAKPQGVEAYTTATPEWGSPQWWEAKEKLELQDKIGKILRNMPIVERIKFQDNSVIDFLKNYLKTGGK